MSESPKSRPPQDDAAVDPAWVKRIARLARLDLSEEEARSMAPQLARILDHVKGLPPLDAEVPVEDAVVYDALRPDEPGAPLDVAAILKNAPRSDGSWLVVPNVFEATEPGEDKAGETP